MTLATDFCAAFIKAYDQMRLRLDDDAQWQANWNTKTWSDLMIYKRDPPAVVRAVANHLDQFCCWEKSPFEPLHLDAVFSAKSSDSWFPICIAIEHENEPGRFLDEIRKLLTIRCPLKVGITYALMDARRNQPKLLDQVEDRIRTEFAAANAVIQEAPGTEYLFLLGYEASIRTLQWHYLIFNAGNSPEGARFQAAPDVA
jgi:hypothetical protein